MIDEYTRECLAIDVARRLNERGRAGAAERTCSSAAACPSYIRSDNGPEFTANAVREWLARVGVKTLFIEPGSPVGERLRRELQRQAARRAAGRGRSSTRCWRRRC